MKILFISSGNSGEISPIVKSQGESLKKFNVSIDFFKIQGKGFNGYFRNIWKLKTHLKNNNYDCVHAHYVLTAIVASLAGANPLVVSLMGSDTSKKGFFKTVINFFISKIWKITIVKSDKMYQEINLKELYVLPNGVNFDIFRPINRIEAINKIGWDLDKKHILFAANPNRMEKNFQLSKAAFELIETKNIELHTLEKVPFELMPYYYNAANVVLLTSEREGSPNVIKEAMACCRPIVTTSVGDVEKVLGDTKNTFVVQSNKESISKALNCILAQEYISTAGRANIQWLNQDIVANKLIEIYKSLQK